MVYEEWSYEVHHFITLLVSIVFGSTLAVNKNSAELYCHQFWLKTEADEIRKA